MTVGETLRKRRRAQDITQEELAEMLHVTPQAVSRWENNAATPDVPSLIGLARIFDCSTDDILGLAAIKREDRIKYYSKISAQAGIDGNAETSLNAWRDALAEFPNDYSVIWNLANNLEFYAKRYEDTDPAKRRAMLEEARDRCDHILTHCADEKILADVRCKMYGILSELGEYRRAEEYLQYLPSMWDSFQMAEVTHAKDTHAASVGLVIDALDILEHGLRQMIHNKQKGFSPKERAEIAGKLEAVHRLFYGDCTATVQPDFFLTLAWAYAGAQDAKNTLRCLKSAAEMAADYDEKDYDHGYPYRVDTVPLRCDTEIRTMSSRTGDYRDGVGKALAESRYDLVRDTPEFAEILRIIAK